MPKKTKPKRQQGKPYTPEEREEIIQSIKPYLQLEYDVKNACMLAEAPYTTVINWIKNDTALCIKVKAWQNQVKAKARSNIANSIKRGNENNSKWWLERREKEEFSTRSENINKNTDISLAELLNETKD